MTYLPNDNGSFPRSQRKRKSAVVSLCLLATVSLTLSACGPARFFYYPTNNLYLDPKKVGFSYEMLQYPSLNGNALFALLFRAQNETEEPKGLVVHFHGNYGNVSNHFLGSAFLTHHGFDVLIFDYQGYGGSQGRPTPRRTVEDGVATLRFANALRRNEGPMLVLAQSLGGAVAIPAVAREPGGVAGMVIQASFTSYRAMTRDVIRRVPLLWPAYPIYPFFVGRRYDPARHVADLPRVPLLFIHGTKDKVIPVRMTKALFDAAHEPKELWLVEGADHNRLRQHAGEAYDQRVAAFFTDAARAAPMTKTPAPAYQ